MDEGENKGHQPPPPNIKKPSIPPPDIKKVPAAPPAPKTKEAQATPSAGPLQVNVTPKGEEPQPREKTEKPTVPLASRVGAAAIDFALGLGLYLAVVIFAGMTFDFLAKLAWPVFLAFILTRDGLPFLNGQSPGKTAMKIKAVTIDDKSLAGNWEPALIRNAVLLIPIFPIVELVILIKREDKRDQGIRLGDEWAKTKVVPATLKQGPEEEADEEAKPDG